MNNSKGVKLLKIKRGNLEGNQRWGKILQTEEQRCELQNFHQNLKVKR